MQASMLLCSISLVIGSSFVVFLVTFVFVCVFFFFQAEDGIRDGRVTGVQTCALPIWHRGAPTRRHEGIEQVAHAADALHVGEWERLSAAEIQALLEQLIDTAVDADDDVAPVHRSPALRGRALALGKPTVDAVAGGVRAHGSLTGVDRPVRHVAELRELPTEQFAVEVNEPLRLGRVYLEVHDEVRHGASLGHSNARYAGTATSSRHPTMLHSAVGSREVQRWPRCPRDEDRVHWPGHPTWHPPGDRHDRAARDAAPDCGGPTATRADQ